MAAEHSCHVHQELALYYPAHDPREYDPHYHIFEATKRRIKQQGLWRCHVPGCERHDLELHHSTVEFSLINGVDVQKFNELYGLHLDDEGFRAWVQGPENTTVLCVLHHRGTQGIHNLRTPEWNALLVWRADLPVPAETIRKDS